MCLDRTEELLTATNSRTASLSVVLTLRGDFVGKALGHRELSDGLQNAQVNLGPMNRDELQTAIQLPADRVGLDFEPGLVNRILDDVGDEPGHLPLLEFVLKRLWEDRRGLTLHHEAYSAMGELQGAIATKADEVFKRLTPLEQTSVRKIFLEIVRPSEDSEDTRRRATFTEIGETNREVVTKLANERLLVTSAAGPADETVEVAHEALIRNWGMLKTWLNEDREFLLWRDRLRSMLKACRDANGDEEALLRGPLLGEASRWLTSHSERMTKDEGEFIATSQKRRDDERRFEQERRDKELAQANELVEAQTRASRRMRKAMVALSIFGISLLVLSTFLFNQIRISGEERTNAQEQAKSAKQQRILAESQTRVAEEQSRIAKEQSRIAEKQSRVSLSRQLAAVTLKIFQDRADDVGLGLLLAVHAVGADPTAEARSVLLSAAFSDIEKVLWPHTPEEIRAIALSRSGRFLASASDKGLILSDLHGAAPVDALLDDYSFRDLAFSPDDKILATRQWDSIRLWDIEKRVELGTLETKDVRKLAFSPDNETLAAASDRTIQLWEVRSRKLLQTLKGLPDDIEDLAFSPNGKSIAVATRKAVVLLQVEMRSLKIVKSLNLQDVESISFSPDGAVLACGGQKGVILWDSIRHKQLERLMEEPVRKVSYANDGKILATIELDSARFWNTVDYETYVPAYIGFQLTERAETAVLSSDGKTFVSVIGDASIVFRETAAKKSAPFDFTHGKGFKGLAFSQNGEMLAYGSDKEIALLDVRSGAPIGQIDASGIKKAIAFSPDGKTVAFTNDFRVFLWDRSTGLKPPKLLDIMEPVGDTDRNSRASVIDVTFTPDGRRLAAMGSSKVIFWDLQREQSSGNSLTVNDTSAWTLAISPDGTILAVGVGRDRGAVLLWDIASQRQLTALKVDQTIYDVSFSPDGKTLASTTPEGAILWDVASRSRLGVLEDGLINSAVAFGPEGKTLFMAGTSTSSLKPALVSWDASLDSWIKKACDKSSRNLTLKEWQRIVGEEIPYSPACPGLPVPKD